MHSGQVPRRELTDSDYDSEALAVQLEQIRKRELQYSDLVARLGKTAPVVCYEDICADPARHVAAICDLMSLEMPTHFEPRKVRLNVLRDELSHRWSERFRAENPGIS
jgi:LPS sulfotransferase NodH